MTATRKRPSVAIPPAPQRRLIGVRLRAWSEWDRQVIQGVRRFAHERPQWRLCVEAGDANESRLLKGKLSLDGIITGTLVDAIPTWKRLLRARGTRVVVVTSVVPAALSAFPRVRVDDDKIAVAIGRHFANGGFRQLAYYRSRPTGPGVEDARMKALLAFADAQGWPCHIQTPRKRQARLLPLSATVRWLRQLPKPVGIATWNMAEARRVVEACQIAGVDIPEQAAVVAWDDDPTLAETLEPTISAAVLPAERLGYEAARLLDRCLTGTTQPDTPVVIEPMGVLHVRQSSDVSTLKDRNAHLALQYIREHGTGPLKVSHIAVALGVSRSKLEREFVHAIRQTPHEAILQVRLARARELMVETDWSLERVADRSGLGTKETLRRVFQRHERMTPGAFRARFAGT